MDTGTFDSNISSPAERKRWAAEIGDLARLADEACGLDVHTLKAGQTVLVQTHHSTYRVEVTEPARCAGRAVGDGSFLTSPTAVTVVGATLSGRGSSVAQGRVLTGFRLVISCDDGEIITSRVRAISVDGMPWFSNYRNV